MAAWQKEARATEDVDVIVAARQAKKAVRALVAAFPHLEALDLPVVTRLRERDTRDVAIDVMKPLQPPHRDIFKHTQTISSQGQTYRIPSLEMAIVLKFAPMISLMRADKDKYQGAHDFILLVENNPEIDLTKLAELGELIYPGGGAEVCEMVRRVRVGEKLKL